MKLLLSNEWLEETLHILKIDFVDLGNRGGKYAYLTNAHIHKMDGARVKDFSLKGSVVSGMFSNEFIIGDIAEKRLFERMRNNRLNAYLSPDNDDDDYNILYKDVIKALDLNKLKVDFVYMFDHFCVAFAQDIH